jgi:hypothetical protein
VVFRDVERLILDPNDPDTGTAQWKKVQAFRKRVDAGKTVYSRSYKDLAGFRALLEKGVFCISPQKGSIQDFESTRN